MKGLPDSFPMIYAGGWVGRNSGISQYSVFPSLSRRLLIFFFPFPVDISDQHVTLRYFIHMFISSKIFPLVPMAIRFSIINKSFCLCGRRCAVVSSIRVKFSSRLQRLKQSYLLTYNQK